MNHEKGKREIEKKRKRKRTYTLGEIKTVTRACGPGGSRPQPSRAGKIGGRTLGREEFRLSSLIFQILALCKKEIPRHIKLAVHVWSTKC